MKKNLNLSICGAIIATACLVVANGVAAGAKSDRDITDSRVHSEKELSLRTADMARDHGSAIQRRMSRRNLGLSPDEKSTLAKLLYGGNAELISKIEVIVETNEPASDSSDKLRFIMANADSPSQLMAPEDVAKILNPAQFKLSDFPGTETKYYDIVSGIDYITEIAKSLNKTIRNPVTSYGGVNEFNSTPDTPTSATAVVTVRIGLRNKAKASDPGLLDYRVETALTVELNERDVIYSQSKGKIGSSGVRGSLIKPVGYTIEVSGMFVGNVTSKEKIGIMSSVVESHFKALPAGLTSPVGSASPTLGEPKITEDGRIAMRISNSVTAAQLTQILNEFAATR